MYCGGLAVCDPRGYHIVLHCDGLVMCMTPWLYVVLQCGGLVMSDPHGYTWCCSVMVYLCVMVYQPCCSVMVYLCVVVYYAVLQCDGLAVCGGLSRGILV